MTCVAPRGRRRAGRSALYAAVLGGAGYAVLQWLGRTYGSTPAERAMPLEGDDIEPNPRFNVTHAITIDARPEQIWPWLVQVGWHRGGWYTPRWVDRLLFPANLASADVVVPDLQHLAVGDFIPDGPPETECGFIVERLEPARALILHSTSHLPLRWRQEFGATIDWSWAFFLRPLADGRTRFIFRWRAVTGPAWVTASCWAAVVPADFVMSRGMLRGVKASAEGYRRARW